MYQQQKLSFRDKLAKNYINAVGWSTKKKLVLIESDDWGSIRMSSKSVYDKLVAEGAGEGSYFDKYDSLESKEDVELLFDVLSSVKDSKGHVAIMQPFAVVANPNYEAIKQNGASEYVYETFIETYKRAQHTEHTFDVIQEGMHSGLWSPQFHGREHVQVYRWVRSIKEGHRLSTLQFGMHSFHSGCTPKNVLFYNAFDYETSEELGKIKNIVSEGIDLFEQIYKETPVAMCPPCGYSNDDLIGYIEGKGLLLHPGQYLYPNNKGGHQTNNKLWGAQGQKYLRFYRRNCKFEPARDHNIDWVDRCMTEMKIAFRWGKPAVIDTHRVNFIGSINSENRDYTLKEMKRLLQAIVKQWPDVEFVNSKELYNEMTR